MISDTQLTGVIEKIDAANGRDPNTETEKIAGEPPRPVPKELLYSQRMSKVLQSFSPDHSKEIAIAARGQHIERWKSPRSNYPDGRAGYKKWRSQLYLFHAARTAELMAEVGIDEASIDRVKFLIQKRQLRRDPETQLLEDVICLVFLQYYFEDFAKKHDEAKLIDIVQKTWKKMSDDGRDAALKLTLPAHMKDLVVKALA